MYFQIKDQRRRLWRPMTKRRPDMLSNMPHGTNVNLVFNYYSFSCNDALKNRNNLAAIHIIITNAITLPGHFHRQRQCNVLLSHLHSISKYISPTRLFLVIWYWNRIIHSDMLLVWLSPFKRTFLKTFSIYLFFSIDFFIFTYIEGNLMLNSTSL